MFGWFAKQQRAKLWGSDPLGRQLGTYSNEQLRSEQGLKLRQFSSEWKDNLEDELRRTILHEIPSSEDPFLRLRFWIAADALAVANHLVLALTEQEKANMPYSKARLISGQLHRHVKLCAIHNDLLSKYLRRFPDATDEDLISYANTNSAAHSYRLNALNIVRVYQGDFVRPKERDWLLPLLSSMMAWAEDMYREKCGLPSLAPPIPSKYLS